MAPKAVERVRRELDNGLVRQIDRDLLPVDPIDRVGFRLQTADLTPSSTELRLREARRVLACGLSPP